MSIYTSRHKSWRLTNTAEKIAAAATPKALAYFWKRVDKSGADGCWLWTGYCGTARGYGQLHFAGTMQRAHRVSWMLSAGPIPPDLLVLHRCDNVRCVNPDHLFLGTNQQNYDDRDAKDRVRHGSRHPRAKLNEALVMEIRRSAESDSVWAKRLGVYSTTVRDARRGTKWRRLPGANPGFYGRNLGRI